MHGLASIVLLAMPAFAVSMAKREDVYQTVGLARRAGPSVAKRDIPTPVLFKRDGPAPMPTEAPVERAEIFIAAPEPTAAPLCYSSSAVSTIAAGATQVRSVEEAGR